MWHKIGISTRLPLFFLPRRSDDVGEGVSGASEGRLIAPATKERSSKVDEEISGIDELRQRYSTDIDVALKPRLRDGEPAAFRLRQLRPIVFLALGKGVPIPGT